MINLAVVYDIFPQIATAAICISTALSFYLYWRSFTDNALLALEGNTGSPIYDFFKGRELNPRLFGTTFDLKFFCELRSLASMIGCCHSHENEPVSQLLYLFVGNAHT